jgi:demethylmenaquinone methyltransferase / 2-methoxy-6-polyprenyl-1,4-benzoquinol methylase
MSSVDKNGQRVQQMFSQIAPRYDLMNHVLSLGIDIRWRRHAVRALRLDTTDPVLDCCTGTGDLALMLAERLAGRAAVIGTDFCLPMLERARSKEQARPGTGSGAVEFLQADTMALPFADHTFQAVTVAFGLRNVQDTQQGLEEMVRVCKPGGQIAVLEFSQPTLPGLRQIYSGYFRHVLPRIGQAVARNNQDAYEYLPNSVAEFPFGEALAALMRAAGMSDVRFQPLTFGVATLYVGER